MRSGWRVAMRNLETLLRLQAVLMLYYGLRVDDAAIGAGGVRVVREPSRRSRLEDGAARCRACGAFIRSTPKAFKMFVRSPGWRTRPPGRMMTFPLLCVCGRCGT